MSAAGDAAVEAYSAHHLVSDPTNAFGWCCACYLAFNTNSNLQAHIRGMIRLAVETAELRSTP